MSHYAEAEASGLKGDAADAFIFSQAMGRPMESFDRAAIEKANAQKRGWWSPTSKFSVDNTPLDNLERYLGPVQGQAGGASNYVGMGGNQGMMGKMGPDMMAPPEGWMQDMLPPGWQGMARMATGGAGLVGDFDPRQPTGVQSPPLPPNWQSRTQGSTGANSGFVANEPVVDMGLLTGKPYAISGEAGPEMKTVTPIKGGMGGLSSPGANENAALSGPSM